MPPSSPCLEEFGLDISKQIILKQVKTYFSKSNKITLKMQVLKVALRIRRWFTSLDIHYNNGQNSESQNASEPK